MSYFYSENYHLWRNKRFNFILSTLGDEYLKDKVIVEFGAGTGALINMFVGRCKKVYAVEGREEHILIGKQEYPSVEFIHCNLDSDFVSQLKQYQFDIIIHTGVLYHLENIKTHIERLKEINCLILILETVVVDSTKECVSMRKEAGFDQSLSGVSMTPSPSYLEKLLKPYYQYDRRTDETLDSYPHFYSLSRFKDDGACDGYHRGFWFCYPLSRIILFDVGSMDGSEFYELAVINPKVIVYAFEPTPESAQKMREKTRHNFKVIEKAVCEKDGTAEFHIAALQKSQGKSGNNSLSDFTEGWENKFHTAGDYYGTVDKIRVETIRLDTFMKQNHIPYIDFLHVDAQGYDKEVVSSLGDYKDRVREGIIEVSTNPKRMLYQHGISLVPALVWLSVNGFEPVQISPNDPPWITNTTEHNIRFIREGVKPRICIYKKFYTYPYQMIVQQNS